MGELDSTDANILALQESVRLDDITLQNPACTTREAVRVRQHKAWCLIRLRELWQERLRLVTSRP